MRHDIIIAICRHNRDNVVIGRVCIIDIVVFAKDLSKFTNKHLVQVDDLLFCPGDFFIHVMSSRVPCPYNEVNGVPQIVVYPLKGCVDKGEW